MTTEQIKLVQDSWNIVAKDAEGTGKLFYSRLFEIAPEVRPLFPEDVTEQSKKLTMMLNYVVVKLHKLGDIINEVKSLAIRHVKYGAKPEHYPVVGAALLWTLEKGLDKGWNPQLAEAWTVCYGTLSGAMIEAVNESNA